VKQPFSKRYLKYLMKKYLKKQQLRFWEEKWKMDEMRDGWLWDDMVDDMMRLWDMMI